MDSLWILIQCTWMLHIVLSNEDCTPQCYVYTGTVSDTSCSVGKRPGDEL